MGASLWCQSEPEHHEPSDQTSWLHTKKKTVAATEQKQQERAAWRAQASQLDVRQLVFIDECGSNIALTPRYGWALKEQRATGSVPRNRGKNTTLIASLGWDGMGESMIIEGAADTAAFEQYVEYMFAPHRISQGRLWSWTTCAAIRARR